ncbi:hypothetical protein F511_46475 [Dorcoceras hygrometricum]|uniref:Uncharacterized protein n=1 Tax=Dorcoceras hygrometricum TaxID=472368 RepID=A0A2Z7A0U1_9LAMI|nr:hypothetical protein F511_46475 [Dorcoceras hygrometricum]
MPCPIANLLPPFDARSAGMKSRLSNCLNAAQHLHAALSCRYPLDLHLNPQWSQPYYPIRLRFNLLQEPLVPPYADSSMAVVEDDNAGASCILSSTHMPQPCVLSFGLLSLYATPESTLNTLPNTNMT